MRGFLFVAAGGAGAAAAVVALVACADLGALTSGNGSEGDAAAEGHVDAGTQGWCAQHGAAGQLLCDDFDEGDGSLKPPWDSITTMTGGAVGVSDAQSVSPPSAFEAQLASASNGCGSEAAVSRTLTIGNQTTFTLAFDFLSDGTAGLTASMLLGTSYYLAVGVGGGAYYLQQASASDPFDASVPVGHWVRVSWSVAVNGDQATVSISLATSPEAPLELVHTTTFNQAPSPIASVLVEIGDRCHVNQGGRDLYYDDVTFTAQ